MFGRDGRILSGKGIDLSLVGMDRLDARKRVVEILTQDGYYRERQSHPMSLAVCSRSGDVIETMIQPQWCFMLQCGVSDRMGRFVKMRAMADRALKAVETGELKLYPRFHEKHWNRWLGRFLDAKGAYMNVRRYTGLVYIPAIMVGPSNSCLAGCSCKR